MAATPTGITPLIEKFEQNLESYRNPAYGETQVRVEFINPLFEALGWDVANKTGHAATWIVGADDSSSIHSGVVITARPRFFHVPALAYLMQLVLRAPSNKGVASSEPGEPAISVAWGMLRRGRRMGKVGHLR